MVIKRSRLYDCARHFRHSRFLSGAQKIKKIKPGGFESERTVSLGQTVWLRIWFQAISAVRPEL